MKSIVASISIICALAAGSIAGWSLHRTYDLERRNATLLDESRQARELSFENSDEVRKLSAKVDTFDYHQELMLSSVQRMLAEPERKDVRKAVESDLSVIADERKFQKQVAYLESIGAPEEAERLRNLRLKVAEILDSPR